MSTQNEKYLNEAGTFFCQVEMPATGWFAESSKGTPSVQIPLIVVEGDLEGKRITAHLWLTEAAFENTVKTLHDVFGFDGDFEALAKSPKGFAGLPASIVTEMETYNGEKRCKLKWLNNPNSGPKPAMEATKVSSLISQINRKSKALVGTFGPAKPVSKKPVEGDDDIPM